MRVRPSTASRATAPGEHNQNDEDDDGNRLEGDAVAHELIRPADLIFSTAQECGQTGDQCRDGQAHGQNHQYLDRR